MDSIVSPDALNPDKQIVIYPHLIPEIEEWPIYKLHKDRAAFVAEVVEASVKRIFELYGKNIERVLARAVQAERIRVKESRWKVDPQNERMYWNAQKRKLASLPVEATEEERRAFYEKMVREIVTRYAEEIVRTFKPWTFRFARRFLTFFFRRLLNTAASRNWRRLYSRRFRLYESMPVRGNIKQFRNLFTKGTVVLVPTHSSNLDSILLGYVLDFVVGVPAFSYGAGLNLYNNRLIGFFMNRLGAYRVDRRKKNFLYLETLKTVSELAIEKGTNSLFFPGGTRSRSGAIEQRLKMGLLGTTVEAQRILCSKNKKSKIFIVPVVLCYHNVLEAKFLIDQYLRSIGKERYFRSRDDFKSLRRILQFAWNVFSRSSKVTVSFGKPMDVVGNYVDEEGRSFDERGHEVDVCSYFLSESGVLQVDRQREAEYTRHLAERIAERYLKDNIVLSTHLVAFAAFEILQLDKPDLDLFELIRLPTDDYCFDRKLLLKILGALQRHLLEMEKRGEVKLTYRTRGDVEAMLSDGVNKLGAHHGVKPLYFDKSGELMSEDFKLLFFYHNRLTQYELEEIVAKVYSNASGLSTSTSLSTGI